MDERHRSPLRILAPLALAGFVVAFLLVVVGSDAGGGSDAGPSPRGEQQEREDLGTRDGDAADTESARRRRARERRESALGADFYTVKAGDTLGGIAETTGIPVETLQTLNPELDPQTLVSGQKIKLRE